MCRIDFLHYLYEKEKNNVYWMKCGFDKKNHGVTKMCGFDLYFYIEEKKTMGFQWRVDLTSYVSYKKK